MITIVWSDFIDAVEVHIPDDRIETIVVPDPVIITLHI